MNNTIQVLLHSHAKICTQHPGFNPKMNSLPILFTAAAVVTISGVFVSAARNPNRPPPTNGKTQAITSNLKVPKKANVPQPVPTVPKGKSTTRAGLSADASEFMPPSVPRRPTQLGSIIPNSKATPTPTHKTTTPYPTPKTTTYPPPTHKSTTHPIPKTTTYPTPKTTNYSALPTTSITSYVPNPSNSSASNPANPGSKSFTNENLKVALPPALYRSISQLGSADINELLQSFFGSLHNRDSSDELKRVLKYILPHTVNKISKEVFNVVSQTGTKCNKEFLPSLDAFLRCYTGIYMVCSSENREYLRKNGFMKSIMDFTVFFDKDGKQFDKLLKMVEKEKAERLNKESLYQLCFSFIRYFRLLISTEMMTNDFERQVMYLFHEFELFLKNNTSKQDVKSLAVYGDVLTLGNINLKDPQKVGRIFAYATDAAYIPSMLIAPFRIYITSMFQKAHRNFLPYDPNNNENVAEAAKSDIHLFWAFVEPAFKAFDDASKFCWNTLAGSSQGMSEGQLIHYTYLQYYLNTRIIGSIELALDHFGILKLSKAMILDDSKTLLSAYFGFEQARLDYPNSPYYSQITVLPSINQPTPYDAISGPGISNIMNSIFEQMNNVSNFELLPEMVTELTVISRVLSSMANSFWFPHSNDKYLCSGNFLRLESKLKSPQQPCITPQDEDYHYDYPSYGNVYYSSPAPYYDANSSYVLAPEDSSNNVFASAYEEYSINEYAYGDEANSNFPDSGYAYYSPSEGQYPQIQNEAYYYDDSYDVDFSLRPHPTIQVGFSYGNTVESERSNSSTTTTSTLTQTSTSTQEAPTTTQGDQSDSK